VREHEFDDPTGEPSRKRCHPQRVRIPAGLVDALTFLRCPVCAAALAPDATALRCEQGHTFDVSRHGHVTLLAPGAKPPAGDGAAMVDARAAFLAAGHYDPIAAAVAAAGSATSAPGCIVEIGAGTGFYLARALAAAPFEQHAARSAAPDQRPAAVSCSRAGIALDSSRPALRLAARAHPRIAAIVADAWRPLPIRDDAAALALCVFAPRDVGELRRIVAPGGRLVVVTPTPRHLVELVAELGLLRVDERKQERLARTLGEPDEERLVEGPLNLGRDDVRALIAMGPSAHHVDADALAKPARTALSVRVASYAV
jgi:23S rRNA (guanine745-N1)-methyltransferase